MSGTAAPTIDHTLDASGLSCPLPILKTRKTIQAMQAGEVLKVISTDIGSQKDIEAFCRQTGHALLGSESEAGSFIFTIRKH
ncbi:MAG: sulfurtransferase TusA family protein [Hyphomicrobiales bacterium]|nr:MAG: sulfurtransferase TusA family protein [Hyphomicrobiales bacterium]